MNGKAIKACRLRHFFDDKMYRQPLSFFTSVLLCAKKTAIKYFKDRISPEMGNMSWFNDGHISEGTCKKGPTRHAYAWQIAPFWQDTLGIKCEPDVSTIYLIFQNVEFLHFFCECPLRWCTESNSVTAGSFVIVVLMICEMRSSHTTVWKLKMGISHGSYWWGHFPDVFEFLSTHLYIRDTKMKSTGARSSNELKWPDKRKDQDNPRNSSFLVPHICVSELSHHRFR